MTKNYWENTLHMLKIILLSLLLSFTVHAEILTMDNIRSEISNTLRNHLKGSSQNIVRQIYAQTNNGLLWLGNSNQKKTSELIKALNTSLFNYKNKGFERKSIAQLYYQIDNANMSAQRKAQYFARLDVIFTNAFVRLVRFVVQGDVDWNLVQKKLDALKKSDDIRANWEMKPKGMPSTRSLTNAIYSGNITGYLTALLPMEVRYRKLIRLLQKYQNIGKFPKVIYTGKVLQLGNSSRNIKQIKQRLQLSGDYPKRASLNNSFDKALQRAVIRFQKRFLIKVTGKVDSTTIYYLNKPVEELIQSIVTNLDKTKLYPKRYENEYIEVNIPDFMMRYYKNGQRVMKSGLIVGRIDRPTPLFNSYVRYMVLNPTWTIPDNLIKRDLIHVLRENPSYLEENNIHVFSGNKEIAITQDMLDPYEHSKRRVPYRFVQFPSEMNALGRVKFMFPNKYAVYLHDTDNKSLFNRRYKIYSSGCMRVEKPFELMHTLLQHSKGYSADRLEHIFGTNKPTTIKLNRPIPVHIVYFTTYEEDGMAYFKHDIYLYDKIIAESAEGFKKATFSIPSNRMIKIKKKDDKPLSN